MRYKDWLFILSVVLFGLLLLYLLCGCALTEEQIDRIAQEIGRSAEVATNIGAPALPAPVGPALSPEAAGGIGALVGSLATVLARLILRLAQKKPQTRQK